MRDYYYILQGLRTPFTSQIDAFWKLLLKIKKMSAGRHYEFKHQISSKGRVVKLRMKIKNKRSNNTCLVPFTNISSFDSRRNWRSWANCEICTRVIFAICPLLLSFTFHSPISLISCLKVRFFLQFCTSRLRNARTLPCPVLVNYQC